MMAAPLPEQLLAMALAWAVSVTESRDPNEIIARQGDFIHRWYVARKATVPALGGPHFEGVTPMLIPSEIENAYLHRYERSDREHLHDHPWDNGTLVLRGRILEQIPGGERMLEPGAIVLRHAEEQHAIREVEPGTLTLFVTLKKRRDWGFIGDQGWVHWRDYSPAFRDVEPVSA